jgi:hypothetical protein
MDERQKVNYYPGDNRIRLEGWFYCPIKEQDDKKDKDKKRRIVDGGPMFDTIKLDKSQFIYSCREFEVSNLEIIPMIRYVGNLFNTKRVQAVIDVKGSMIPFFIEETKIKALRALISMETDIVRL